MIKRVCIYHHFDARGFVDNYIGYFLSKLSANLDRLVIVCNGSLTSQAEEYLRQYTSDLIIRSNEGFDAAGYMAGMEYLGWDYITNVDELILANSSVMGPVDSFDSMFNQMESLDCDFWGITLYPGNDGDPTGCCPYGFLPPHLQTYFVAFRHSLLCSGSFRSYWCSLPPLMTYNEVVGKHEACMTKHFEDAGFSWRAFCAAPELDNLLVDPFQLAPLELIKYHGCPVFKRKNFFMERDRDLPTGLVQCAGRRLFDYLADSTTYDIDMVLQHIIRTGNQRDIADSLNLSYVLPGKNACESNGHGSIAPVLIAIAKPARNIDQLVHMDALLEHIPNNWCTVTAGLNRQGIWDSAAANEENIISEKSPYEMNSYTSFLAFAVAKADSASLICAVGPFTARNGAMAKTSSEYAYYCDVVLARGANLVCIPQVFEDNPRLGLLLPQPSSLNESTQSLKDEWRQVFKTVCDWALENEIDVPINSEKPPISNNGCFFWVRKQLLQRFLDTNPSSAIIPWAFPLFVQWCGYYPAYLETEESVLNRARKWEWEYDQTRDSLEGCLNTVLQYKNELEGSQPMRSVRHLRNLFH